MAERGTLERLLGEQAVARISADILKQIQEYQYEVEGKPRPKPKKRKPLERGENQAGFWVTYEGQMIAVSDAQGITLEMHQEALETTSMDSGGMREFIAGPMSADFNISQLRILEPAIFRNLFQEGVAMDLVATVVQGGMSNASIQTFSGMGIILSFSLIAGMATGGPAATDRDILTADAIFRIQGELIRS